MSQSRIGRINEEIMRELSTAIRGLKDPRVQQMLSITAVDTASDLRTAKVYVSVFDKEKSREVLKGLKSAGGYLRRHIGSALQLRYTPELQFTLDESLKKGAQMYDLLSRLADETRRAQEAREQEQTEEQL